MKYGIRLSLNLFKKLILKSSRLLQKKDQSRRWQRESDKSRRRTRASYQKPSQICAHKNHFENQIIGDKSKVVQTRRRVIEASNQENYYFLSLVEPKSYEEEIKEESWVRAMEEELNQIQKNQT